MFALVVDWNSRKAPLCTDTLRDGVRYVHKAVAVSSSASFDLDSRRGFEVLIRALAKFGIQILSDVWWSSQGDAGRSAIPQRDCLIGVLEVRYDRGDLRGHSHVSILRGHKSSFVRYE